MRVEIRDQAAIVDVSHRVVRPDAAYATTGGTRARLVYYDNFLVDNHSCVIVGVQAMAADAHAAKAS